MFSRQAVSRGHELARLSQQLCTRHKLGGAAFRGWWSPEVLASGIEQHVDSILSRCFDSQAAADLRHRCPVPGLNDQDYLSRVLATPDGRVAITSTRFLGLDIERPFVELEGATFTMTERDFAELRTATKVIYRRMCPRWLRVFVTVEDLDEPWIDSAPWKPDLVVMAGPTAELREQAPPAHSNDVKLRPWDGTDERFAIEYAALEDAESASGRSPRRREVLEELAANGWLYDIVSADESSWVGLIGAASEPLMGLPAIAMHEQVIASAHRGQRLAAAAQRHLIDTLPSAVLWGTIAHDNRPSLRTARRCGRVEVGHYRLYEL